MNQVVLLVTICLLSQIQDIDGSCNAVCGSSNCCSDCCESNTNCGSSSCCGTSNCCDDTSCCGQTSCCNRCQATCRTTTCYNDCRQNCCRCGGSTRTTSSVTQTSISPTFPTAPTPPGAPTSTVVVGPVPSKGSETQSTNENTNTHNVNNNVTLNLNLENTINNENHVHVPINITNHNDVHVQVTGGSTQLLKTDKEKNTITTTGKPGGDHNNTIIEVVTVPVPFPVPVPIPVPQPCEHTGCCHPGRGCHVPAPNIGCCIVVVPCIQPCNPFNHVCNDQCSSNFMFTPINPCGMGCQRRPFAMGNACSMSGYCRQTMSDCSGCSMNDFFTSYGGYQQCGGCFY